MSARVKKYDGSSWTDITLTRVGATFVGTVVGPNYISDLEVTITTGSVDWTMVQAEWHCNRMAISQSAVVSSIGGYLGGDLTFGDGINIPLKTTTGTKIGTATTQKLGFFNATPVIQQGATTDLGTVLSTLGLRASGTAYPITTTGLATLGSAIISSNLTVNGAINIKGTNITDMIAASTNPIPAQTAAAIANATNAIVQAGWLLYDAGSNKWLRVTVSNYSYYISEVL
jgi:hypothetical protein